MLIPATILTGFLGSGKTTLLRRVLNEAHGRKIAVIENEFGEENIDAEILLADAREQIVQMSNGCICCTIREDLRLTLRELADKQSKSELQFERVVIETTGLADPGPVAQTFFLDDEICKRYLLDSILTMVDAKHANQSLDDRQEARRQVGFADQIFISKTDLTRSEDVEALTHRLRRMNPRAPQKAVHFGKVAISDVFDQRSFNLSAKLDIDVGFLSDEEHDHADHGSGHCENPSIHHGARTRHRHDDDVGSFVFRSHDAFDPRRLGDFLGAMANAYGSRLLRYKGVLHMQDMPNKIIFQGVHQLLATEAGPAWAEGEPRGSKMVFIGIDLPKEMFLRSLEQCLVPGDRVAATRPDGITKLSQL
jgi:G3E family GTPase